MSGANRWTWRDVPDQGGRTAVVTGSNSGIGYEAALALAQHGAAVVLACRDLERAEGAAANIRAAAPGATVSTLELDLASLASVRRAAEQLRGAHDHLDLLIDNAGLMFPPYGRTEDGFELQFGTNHLGHFALTGLVLDRLLATPGSRVVTVSSTGHRAGAIDFDDPQFERRRYRRFAAYSQSKLANLLFTYELQRRLEAADAETIALAAHPGLSNTELSRFLPGWTRPVAAALGQDARMGALPTLRAAVDPAARGGEYYGPGGWMEMRGFPTRVGSSARSHDAGVQRRLWELSEELTGVSYPLTERSAPRP
jgi:NAD(P)-dependent dehydrogenase (short-subunit alcohol dehydrogenase family)